MKSDDLKKIRKELDLTQVELAELLEVQPNTVSRWELGQLPISKVVEFALLHLKSKKR